MDFPHFADFPDTVIDALTPSFRGSPQARTRNPPEMPRVLTNGRAQSWIPGSATRPRNDGGGDDGNALLREGRAQPARQRIGARLQSLIEGSGGVGDRLLRRLEAVEGHLLGLGAFHDRCRGREVAMCRSGLRLAAPCRSGGVERGGGRTCQSSRPARHDDGRRRSSRGLNRAAGKRRESLRPGARCNPKTGVSLPNRQRRVDRSRRRQRLRDRTSGPPCAPRP